MAMSGEYSSGTIRATFSAAPNRVRVLLAKLLVFGVLAVVFAEVVAFASFFLGQALLTAPATHATLSSPGALRAVAGCGLYVAALGVLALGLATMMRHTAAALSTFVGILLIAPLVLNALPTSISLDVRRYLPDRIGATILTTNGSTPFAFSPWIGLAVLAGYAVGVNIIGAVLLARRDA
jgi:ABC-2 type transport system permease protein